MRQEADAASRRGATVAGGSKVMTYGSGAVTLNSSRALVPRLRIEIVRVSPRPWNDRPNSYVPPLVSCNRPAVTEIFGVARLTHGATRHSRTNATSPRAERVIAVDPLIAYMNDLSIFRFLRAGARPSLFPRCSLANRYDHRRGGCSHDPPVSPLRIARANKKTKAAPASDAGAADEITLKSTSDRGLRR